MAKRGRQPKGRGSGGGGLVALIKSIVSSYVKDERGKSAPAAKPRNATEAFYQQGAKATVREVFAAQGTTVEPPNRPPPPAPPGTAGRLNPMGRLTVPGADPINRPAMTPPPTREYSALTRSLGGSILRMGPSVPPHIQKAALDAVDGTGNYKSEAQLLNIMRDSLGIRKTGATEARATLRSVNSGIRDVTNAAVLMDVASRGGPQGSVAVMGLVQMAVSKVADVASSQTMKGILQSTLGNFAGERAFRSVRNAVRSAGPLIAAAETGWNIGSYVEQNASFLGGAAGLAQAKATGFDKYKQTGMDPKLQKAIRDEAFEYEEATGNYFWDKSLNEATNKRRDKVVDQIVGMRDEAQSLGIDVAGAVGKWASERGINPDQLTPENRAMIVDLEIKKKRDDLMRHTPENMAFVSKKMMSADLDDRFLRGRSDRTRRIQDETILSDRAEAIFKLAKEQRQISEADFRAFMTRWQAEATKPKNMGGRLGVVTLPEMQQKLREFDTEKTADARRHKVEWDD